MHDVYSVCFVNTDLRSLTITYIIYTCSTNVLHENQRWRPFLCPPLKKEGHIALHMSVGMSVCRYVGRYAGRSVGMSVALNLVQLITQERFVPEASNLVGR